MPTFCPRLVFNGRENWRRERALRYLQAIVDVFDALARFPDRGRRADDVGANVRLIRAADHIVYYEYDERILTILRILPKRMNPARLVDEGR